MAVFRLWGTANQTNLTYPDKSTVTNSYDALGQLTQTTDGDGGKYTYTYDDAGNVTKLSYDKLFHDALTSSLLSGEAGTKRKDFLLQSVT